MANYFRIFALCVNPLFLLYLKCHRVRFQVFERPEEKQPADEADQSPASRYEQAKLFDSSGVVKVTHDVSLN